MKKYILDLATRLSNFSERLDNLTLFVDKPWVLIDNDENYHKYIFKRNGELVMSINGSAQIGRWELLLSANSILIDRIADKLLVNHFFIDEGVMVLKIDGSISDYFVLANEILIPDLNIKKYLQKQSYRHLNIMTGQLAENRTLEIHRHNEMAFPTPGMVAMIDGEIPEDGSYPLISNSRIFKIRDGKILRITYPIEFCS